MEKIQISLRNVQDVRDFVSQVVLLDYEVDLVQGRYVVDAKSIMGIFSLDLMSPITVLAHTEHAAPFFEAIAAFIVS